MTLLLLACLGSPALAQDAPPPTPAGPALTDEERKLLFQGYHSAMASGDRPGAAEALSTLMNDPKHGPQVSVEANKLLAAVLPEMDMPYAGLLAWRENRDWTAADKKAALELAEKVGDEDAILDRLLPPIPKAVEGEPPVAPPKPPPAEPREAYLKARYLVRAKHFDHAMPYIDQVPAGSDVFVDAQLLKGVALANSGKPAVALAPLLTAHATGKDADQRKRDLLNLNVARAYYASKNWPNAIQHYAKVSRGSVHWPEVQFEKGWAHFRADDMTGALSALENLRSGFFDGWYFPEAELLRGYALFMMCKFPTAGDQLDSFQKRYEPVKAQLDEAAALTPEEAFADVRAFKEGKRTRLPPHVLRRFSLEDQFNDALAAVDEADRELKLLENETNHNYATHLEDALKKRKTQVMSDQGARVLGTALKARSELGKMLGDIEISRLDILRYETQLYERAAATGELDYGDRIGKLRKLRKTRRAWVWPFEGEYWGDELGWYKVDARPDCPDGGLASGGGAPR